MTIQIDDQYTSWLVDVFTTEQLSDMSASQRETLRDAFVAGVLIGSKEMISDPAQELAAYYLEIGTDTAKTKARHCAQEALIIKRAGN